MLFQELRVIGITPFLTLYFLLLESVLMYILLKQAYSLNIYSYLYSIEYIRAQGVPLYKFCYVSHSYKYSL